MCIWNIIVNCHKASTAHSQKQQSITARLERVSISGHSRKHHTLYFVGLLQCFANMGSGGKGVCRYEKARQVVSFVFPENK